MLNNNAESDALSRHPVGSDERIDTEIARIQQDHLSDFLVDLRQVRHYSTIDQQLTHAIFYTRIVWTSECPKEEL